MHRRRRGSTAARPIRRTASANGAGPAAASRRTKVIWAALAASMTVVGGLLLALDGRPVPRLDGLALAPLAATDAGTGIGSIFNTRRPLHADAWDSIVIHHSGTIAGSQKAIAALHEARTSQGMGHHFLVGNGHGMADGEIYVGYRWLEQLSGAHAEGPDSARYNARAVSICLIGDGDARPFTQAQVGRLVQLVALLCRDLGIPRDRVLLHRAIAPTTDPGRLFPEAEFRAGLLGAR